MLLNTPNLKSRIENFLSRFIPKRIQKLIGYGISACAILYLIYMLVDNWQSLRQYEWNINYYHLLGSFLTYVLAVIIAGVVWIGIMKYFQNNSGGGINHLRVFCISRLGYRIPGPLLQIPGRVYLYKGQADNKAILLSSGLEMFIMLVSAGIISLFSADIKWNFIIVLISLVGIIFLLWISLKLTRKVIFRIDNTIQQLSFPMFLTWIILHVIVWAIGALSIYLLIKSFYPLDVNSFKGIIWSWGVSGLVSIVVTILPAGLGLRELSLSLLLSNFVPTGIAALTSILSRFLLLLFDFIIAIITYFIPTQSRKV